MAFLRLIFLDGDGVRYPTPHSSSRRRLTHARSSVGDLRYASKTAGCRVVAVSRETVLKADRSVPALIRETACDGP